MWRVGHWPSRFNAARDIKAEELLMDDLVAEYWSRNISIKPIRYKTDSKKQTPGGNSRDLIWVLHISSWCTGVSLFLTMKNPRKGLNFIPSVQYFNLYTIHVFISPVTYLGSLQINPRLPHSNPPGNESENSWGLMLILRSGCTLVCWTCFPLDDLLGLASGVADWGSMATSPMSQQLQLVHH